MLHLYKGFGNGGSFLGALNIPENNTGQVSGQFFLAFPGQLRHIFHIHPRFFGDGYGKGFAGGVHAGDGFMGADCALGEHIRLAFEVTFLIQHLQRTQQAIAGVLAKGKAVAPAGKQTVLFRVIVIQTVQFRLFFLNILIRVALGLILDQPADTFPNGDHTPDTVFSGDGYLYRVHTGIFTVIHFAVHKAKTEIAHRRVCGDRAIFLLVQFLHLIIGDLRMEVLHSFGKQLGQVCVLVGPAGAVHAEPGGFHDHIAQYHFRVLHKISVHTDTVFIGVQMHPIRLYVRHSVTLLQKDNVAGNFGSCVGLKRIVGQPDSPDQIGSLCQVLANSRVFLVHRTLGGDERDHAARAHLIQRLSKKIVVDQPVVLVVFLIPYLEIAKRHIADGHIKEAVGHLHLFEAIHGNAAVLIELLCNPPADGVDFHTVGFAVRHAVRQHTDEISNTAGRLQNISLPEAHLRKCLVHGPDDDRGSVKGGKGAGSGGSIFVLVKQGFQLQIFSVALIKTVSQTAPTHIPGEDFLFFWSGKAFLGFNLFQSSDGSYICGVFFAAGAVAQL